MTSNTVTMSNMVALSRDLNSHSFPYAPASYGAHYGIRGGPRPSGLAMIAARTFDDDEFYSGLATSLHFIGFPVTKEDALRFAVLHLLGLHETMSLLSGTLPGSSVSWEVSAVLFLMYFVSYMGFVLVAPCLS